MIARIFDQFLINQDTTYKLFLCMRFANRYKLKHERDSLASVFIRHAYQSPDLVAQPHAAPIKQIVRFNG